MSDFVSAIFIILASNLLLYCDAHEASKRAIIFQLCQENFKIMRIVICSQDVDELETSQLQEDGPNNKKRQGPKHSLHSKQITL
jgi:hypothetical protein